MSSTMKVVCAMLVLTAASPGCSSSRGGGGVPGPEQRNKNRLTARELEDPSVRDGSLLEAIRHLRPNFLVRDDPGLDGRAPGIEVSINNGPPASLSTLDHYRPADVASITLLSPSDAVLLFGMRPTAGPVLVVRLK